MNLADLSAEERAAIEADKAACFIRYQCRHMKGRERQVRAKQLLLGYSVEQQELIKKALTVRAGR